MGGTDGSLEPGVSDRTFIRGNETIDRLAADPLTQLRHGTYAIVLTCDRPELLEQCLEAIHPQVDLVFTIDNGAFHPRSVPDGVFVLPYPKKPPNLSKMWNLGIDWVTVTAGYAKQDTWDIAFLCDDAIVHPTWFLEVTTEMRAMGAAAGSTHCATPVTSPILKMAPDHDIWNRMCPWAFVLRGEAGIRADEDLQWWWGDTAVDFTARLAGGMVLAPGAVVQNQKMGEYTNIYAHLAEQAGRDGETFAAKWGRPW